MIATQSTLIRRAVRWIPDRDKLFTWLVFLLPIPIYYYNALRYPTPMGFGGLYGEMAEALLRNGFRLPVTVPYYVPGGLPLVYPPLAIYLMAGVMKLLNISYLMYMRFAPPLFTWLALISLYVLYRELLGNRRKAMLAILLIFPASSMFFYYVGAGGAVRAPALVTTLAGLVFANRAMQHYHWKDVLLAGVCLGLTALIHLSHLVFFGLSLLVLLPSKDWMKSLLSGLVLGLVGVLVMSPWVIWVLRQYSLDPFLAALGSHKNLSFLGFSNPQVLWAQLVYSFGQLANASPLLGALTLPALLMNAYWRRWRLLAWFAITLLFVAENDRFLVMLAALLCAEPIAFHFRYLAQAKILRRLQRAGLALSAMMIGVLFVGIPVARALSIPPRLTSATLGAAEWIKKNTQEEDTLLLLAEHEDTMEWGPALFERNAVNSYWGAEWTGDFSRLTQLWYGFKGCYLAGSAACLDELIQKKHLPVDTLVVWNDGNSAGLLRDLANNPRWSLEYENSGSSIWKRTS